MKGLLQEGISCRVGKEDRISIREDVWLAGAVNYKVGGIVNDNSLITVYDLTDHSRKVWNVNLIKRTFKENDANQIVRILLARMEHEDLVMWQGKWAITLTKNYLLELDGLAGKEITRRNILSTWTPHKDPFIRINIDAAFDQKEFRSISGVIVRNGSEESLLTKSSLHEGVASPFAAEALACAEAIAVGRCLEIMSG
ncbi:hypothetical protein J1N35_013537 [Gossypium stocksii]|uniref:RNase H type-1 domain-containing protein n=1 Tax=Gossypium stocksii TaxID=47602 RepID=A0A9D3VV23_9ROSI|nr:hypothetical protein J1N35_013537 [Gossypium stocksii]